VSSETQALPDPRPGAGPGGGLCTVRDADQGPGVGQKIAAMGKGEGVLVEDGGRYEVRPL
jgi:hypothetical protein